jgi:hypothetical protein
MICDKYRRKNTGPQCVKHDLKFSHSMKSSLAVSCKEQLKENNVLEATIFSNFKTLVTLHYLTQLRASKNTLLNRKYITVAMRCRGLIFLTNY